MYTDLIEWGGLLTVRAACLTRMQGARSFLVKWQGFTAVNNQWVEEVDILDKGLIASFKKAIVPKGWYSEQMETNETKPVCPNDLAVDSENAAPSTLPHRYQTS